MSTICWDGKELVVDSLDHEAGLRRQLSVRRMYTVGTFDQWKVHNCEALAFAFLSSGNPGPWIAEALTKHLTHRTELTGRSISFQAVIVCKDAVFEWRFANGSEGENIVNTLLPVTGKLSIGTGVGLATALLSIGLSSHKVMETVCKWDLQSGGEVMSFIRPPAQPLSKSERAKGIFERELEDLQTIAAELRDDYTPEQRDEVFNKLHVKLGGMIENFEELRKDDKG